MIIKGNDNTVNLGTIILCYSNILGMSGLKLIIGQLPGLGAGVSRVANNCRVDIGNRVVINGVTLYLQEDKSNVSIGEDSQLSWGIDIWCTDAHTITNLKREPINFAQSIEIGKHAWVGKDVKIGKNTKIPDNSIVGWGSIFRFPFFFLYGPSSFHQRSYHISPFSPLHFLCSVMLSSISALPCIVRLSSSTLACHILLMFSHFSTL